ncbi:MAG: ParB N-terminal domain-containing protein [Steroidobacteraceae bacterium]
MEVELHQLLLRYERLRKRHPRAERALLASLAEIGQQVPVVVVGEAEGFVLIDGYKRVRALRRLARDVVLATRWELEEVEALLLERGLRRGSEDALDQAWLIAELQERFGYSLDDLARRFEHSKSWVSGRLGLIQCLPASVQEHVRLGALSAHAAMKYLVPMARADLAATEKLAATMLPLRPTTREVAALYAGWQCGSSRTRELILESPKVYLEAKAASPAVPPSATQRLLDDLGALGGIARRALRALQTGLLQQLLDNERLEVHQAFARAKSDLERLFHRIDLEYGHAG